MNSTVIPFGPGESPPVWRSGDFLLARNLATWHSKAGFISGMIRLGQRLRLHGDRKKFALWNHAIAISEIRLGDAKLMPVLVEALGHGVQYTPTNAYTPQEYLYIATDLNDGERQDFVQYVNSMVGTQYGYLTIVSIAIKLITGIRLGFSQEKTVICSGLVCAALGIYRWRSNPSLVMPSDLAEFHNISLTPGG